MNQVFEDGINWDKNSDNQFKSDQLVKFFYKNDETIVLLSCYEKILKDKFGLVVFDTAYILGDLSNLQRYFDRISKEAENFMVKATLSTPAVQLEIINFKNKEFIIEAVGNIMKNLYLESISGLGFTQDEELKKYLDKEKEKYNFENYKPNYKLKCELSAYNGVIDIPTE